MSDLYKLIRVGFRYGQEWVLREIDLTIARGEILGIIGPNGTGKTSLLKLLGGLLRPAEGEILLDSGKLESIPRRNLARRIGLVPQETPLNFPFSVQEVVLMGRSPYLDGWALESDEDVRIARTAIEKMDVQKLADRLFDDLSGGERQRVIIARTLAQNPEVFLLDEPATFLDLHNQILIYSMLKGLNRRDGITIAVVMHDLNMAARLCDRLLLMGDGKIARLGTPSEVLTENLIEEIFHCRNLVDSDPTTGRPRITLLSEAP